MNNVIGVFISTDIADQVIGDLTSSGFSSGAVTRYDGGSSDLESRLIGAGVEASEAREYAESVPQGGALVVAQAEDAQTDEAVAVMNRYYEASQSSAQYATGDAQTATDVGEARLAVAEEQLLVGKREVSRGGVRVRSVVRETPVEQQVTLRDETVHVERRPVDRPVSDADTNVFNNQALEFTETDEEAVVAKEARVVEEIVIGKSVEERTETVRDTVRRTDVEIEELGASYGESMASDPRYAGREWSEVESEARTNWESTSADKGTWEQVQGSVKGAWDRLRGKS